jgi:cytochrome P450
MTIADPAVQSCPYEYYDGLRTQAAVVHDPATDLWIVTGHAALTGIARDWPVFSSEIDMRRDIGGPDSSASDALFTAEGYLVEDVLSQVDPPRHTAYRALVERLFTAPVVARLEAHIEFDAQALIDGFVGAGECDVFSQFAVPLPLSVIADQLGVPKADLPRFQLWTDAIVETLGIMLTPERKLACTRLIIEFQHYFVARLAEKRVVPADDIISGLAAATLDDGRSLTTEELLAFIQQLLVAGNETTRHHIARCVQLLGDDQALQARLRADPALIPRFVEETLRLESPVQGLFRVARQAVIIDGIEVPAGAKLFLAFGAANRDPGQFPCPAQLDIDRRNAHTHVAFGSGPHRCVGQMLARKELAIAIKCLLARLPAWRVANQGPLLHRPNMILRSLAALQISYAEPPTAEAVT